MFGKLPYVWVNSELCVNVVGAWFDSKHNFYISYRFETNKLLAKLIYVPE